jgi:carboxypeptidase C (cathepsin A)
LFLFTTRPISRYSCIQSDVPVESGAKNLFYWYFEATESPETKPLLLWLNGGPGCSSLAGMWVENGPFVLDKDLNISLNPYSWNKVANVLYLEQPAGVGFSYPAGKTNDEITSTDTYNGLLGFLDIHTELKGRPFFIAG